MLISCSLGGTRARFFCLAASGGEARVCLVRVLLIIRILDDIGCRCFCLVVYGGEAKVCLVRVLLIVGIFDDMKPY